MLHHACNLKRIFVLGGWGFILSAAVLTSPPAAAQSLVAGYAHTCAVGGIGQLKCWGANESGQLGDGTTTNRLVPTIPFGAGPIGAARLTAGSAHTCAELLGVLKCWGSNQAGQLGDGTLTNRLTPVAVNGLPPPLRTMYGMQSVRAVSAGTAHTCAITAHGAVMCWGNNSRGQLGNGTYENSSLPVAVVGIPEGAVAIAAGELHSCAVTTAGALKCWGSNVDQQILGFADLSGFMHITPVTVAGLGANIVDVTVGARHTCARTSARAMRCIGRNTSGELGNGTFFIGLSARPVVGFESGTVSMHGAETHTCAVLAEGQALLGRAKCWGNNADFKLGHFYEPGTQNFPRPENVVNLSADITHVVGGHAHSCAIDYNNRVSCWGNNDQGQLGDGTTNSQIFARPVRTQ